MIILTNSAFPQDLRSVQITAGAILGSGVSGIGVNRLSSRMDRHQPQSRIPNFQQHSKQFCLVVRQTSEDGLFITNQQHKRREIKLPFLV
jgi:hypothetical protein